ncbi:MAG: response regulator transcription factor [Verrucomicrobiaceae bacterium]|nr:MAG: response regulator transcription factor [Verrucomicrobiaceae bacterium]
MNGTTIHLVDDDAGLRKALSRLLRAEGYEVRAFASAAEFLASCHAREIECLLLDVSMPDLDGLELQRRLVRSGATVPIVFLTGYGDIPMSVRAVKAGAVDFLTKPVGESELLQAVRTALAQSAADRNEREETSRIAARFSRLTPREREVLEGVVAGKPNKIIAAELGTCEQTVKVHRGRVMEKMGAESLAELVRAADRIGALKKLAICKAG